ncbi:unnamed protein product [Pleuronectes platessa]|uniref:Uncharacterized protein n=1 Tax=Pleuronectes platessa TaxID=8262 RepID=A0A9N7YQJ8_PLEPL|nr:unnamed protein product [Pleuronectes platessa]
MEDDLESGGHGPAAAVTEEERVHDRRSGHGPAPPFFSNLLQSSNLKVSGSIPSLTHLQAEVSLGKMLNPEWPPHRITKCCDTD